MYTSWEWPNCFTTISTSWLVWVGQQVCVCVCTRVRSMPSLSWDSRWRMMLLWSSKTPRSSSSLSSVSVISSLESTDSELEFCKHTQDNFQMLLNKDHLWFTVNYIFKPNFYTPHTWHAVKAHIHHIRKTIK